jgi:UDP-GlcNAc:undecaprenyl-phosphate/decaprenyl-phosphate GlcNAc-1-phosphate transferase
LHPSSFRMQTAIHGPFSCWMVPGCDWGTWVHLVISGLIALVVGVGGCWLLLGWAERLRLVDHPVGRKDHAHPTPVIGGLAVYLALLAGICWLNWPAFDPAASGMLIAGALLMAVGVADDIRDLPWPVRICVQAGSALVLCASGSELLSLSLPGASISLDLGILAIPFTVFAVVGLINAVNMIDGVDGLSGTIVATTLVLMAGLSFGTGNSLLGSELLVAVAAMFAFLGFNLRIPGRAKALTFLGNSGSALLGLLLAWSAIQLTQGPQARITPAVAPWLVALPILDCLTLIGRRLAGRRSPFAADRMHFHHLLLDRGFTVPQVVAAGVGLHLSLALLGLALMVLGVPDLWLIGGFLLVLATYALIAVGALSAADGGNPDPELVK